MLGTQIGGYIIKLIDHLFVMSFDVERSLDIQDEELSDEESSMDISSSESFAICSFQKMFHL